MSKEEKPLPPRVYLGEESASWWSAPNRVADIPYIPESSLKAAVAEARASAFEEAANLKVQRRQGRGPGKAVLCEIHLDHDVREALLTLAKGARETLKSLGVEPPLRPMVSSPDEPPRPKG